MLYYELVYWVGVEYIRFVVRLVMCLCGPFIYCILVGVLGIARDDQWRNRTAILCIM
jgi:hypothetical protein